VKTPQKKPPVPFYGTFQPGPYGVFICSNCGQHRPKMKANQRFCNDQCRYRFWNRGNREIRKLEIRANDIEARVKKLESTARKRTLNGPPGWPSP